MASLPSENMSLSIGPVELSTDPTFFQPKSFWDIWNLSDSLFSRVALSFQWVSGRAEITGNEQAH